MSHLDYDAIEAKRQELQQRKFNRLSQPSTWQHPFHPAYEDQEHATPPKFLEPQEQFVPQETVLPVLGLENYQIPFLEEHPVVEDLPEWEDQPDEKDDQVQDDQPLGQRAHYQPTYTTNKSEAQVKAWQSKDATDGTADPEDQTNEDQEKAGFTPQTMPTPYPADDIEADYQAVIDQTRIIAQRMYKSLDDYLLFAAIGGTKD